MKKIGLYLLLLGSIVFCSTCLDEIEIDPAQRPEIGYVIQGKLITGPPATAEVKVERLFVYTSNINEAVPDAEVRLLSETGAEFTFSGVPLDGIYRAALDPADFPVEIGARYRIEVSLPDGNEITSDWDQIIEAPPTGNLGWQFDEIELVSDDGLVSLAPGIAFNINSPLRNSTGDKVGLRWEFIDAFRITDDFNFVCYVENPYQAGRVFLLDGNTVSGDSIQGFPLFNDRFGQKLTEGYYLSAYQQVLSPASFDYWREIALLLEREGTVFDNPAGRVQTNMENTTDSTAIVYGYFSAYQQDTIRLFISPEDLGNPDRFCPRPPTNAPFPPPTICDGCIDALGSSYEKPFYWE